MIEALQNFTATLPPVLQWLGVVLGGAIPFIESYFGSVIGVVAGINPIVATAAAISGNIVSMVVLVVGAHSVRRKIAPSSREPNARRQKLRRTFDKYGVAGVSLLGQTILPSQVTSAAMVSFGAPRNAVIFWQVVSIVVWGVVFGALATLGVDLFAS
jgi:hypothetical protein